MKVLYYLTYAVLWLFSLLPMWVHYLISDGIYVVVYHLVGYRKKMVRKNLSDSFPEKSEAEIVEIEKDFYRWFCDYLVETIKLHYCNWEWITSLPLWVTPKAQCGQIYHVLENSEFDRLFLNLRQRMGAVCIPMAETLRRLAEYRQKQQPVVIGYISDQVPFWNNIHRWLDFLHHDTPVLTGTERLARSAGHAVLYIDVERPRRGYYVATFKLIERDPKLTKDFELTDAYFRLLEASIRRAPQYWLWTHNRWKRTHEEFNIRYDEATGRVSLEDLDTIKRKKGLI